MYSIVFSKPVLISGTVVLQEPAYTQPIMAVAGKVIVVTGASSGIGAAIALALAREGGRLGLVGRDRDRLHHVRDQVLGLGGQAVAVQTDVVDREAVMAMKKEVVKNLGEVDVLVNNAGLSVWQYMVNCDQDSWDKMIDVNIRGSLNCIAAVLPGMVERRSGYIVNMSSVRGVVAGTGGAVYGGTKHFIEGLSNGLRQEVAGKGVRVSTVQPSLVDTPLITMNLEGGKDGQGKDKEAVEDRRNAMAGMAGSLLNSEDVGRAVVFLLSQPAHCTIPCLPVQACAQQFS